MVKRRLIVWRFFIVLSIIFPAILTSCAEMNFISPGDAQNTPMVEIVFNVTIPQQIDPEVGLFIEFLDEVTGLGLNPSRYQLQAKDELNYFIRLPITKGAVVKYRYVKGGTPPLIEYDNLGDQIRYRMLYATNPREINDSVIAWHDLPFTGKTGTVEGFIVDNKNDAPLPGVMVIIAGLRTFTASDGSYSINNVPIGEHQLTAYHRNGDYLPFQQTAIIADGAITPALFGMQSSKTVNITFKVTPPPNHIPSAPIRLIGNLSSLGNTFADIKGGLSTIASHAPFLTYQADNQYSITISLPASHYVEYKYSLGDGFWNAELNNDGSFHIRRILVPERDMTIKDNITTWGNVNYAPITFNITVPENTPSGDIVSIQLDPFDWMEPIPMWSLGNNQWTYTLFNPMEFLSAASFRVCRNDQCGIADDILTSGQNAEGIKLDLSQTFIQYAVSEWEDLPLIQTTNSYSDIVQAKSADFMAGIEFQTNYSPSWINYIEWAYLDISKMNSKWVFITPTWSFLDTSPDSLIFQPAQNPEWPDIIRLINSAQQFDINTAVFPHAIFPINRNTYWKSADKSVSWWNEWLTRYRTFILNFADLSAQNNVKALVIGGFDFSPALPAGKLFDGSRSNTPYDFMEKWKSLITEIRTRYSGQLILALPYPYDSSAIKELGILFDGIYIQIQSPLVATDDFSLELLSSTVDQLLDKDIYPLYSLTLKPILIGVKYPSATGAPGSCIHSDGYCISVDDLDQPCSEKINASIDFDVQSEIYLAFLKSIQSREWIKGFISEGYYPPVLLLDSSSSIRGKPAEQLLTHWFKGLQGIQ